MACKLLAKGTGVVAHYWKDNKGPGDYSMDPPPPDVVAAKYGPYKFCMSESGHKWVCTRSEGHEGVHVAHLGEIHVCAWWY